MRPEVLCSDRRSVWGGEARDGFIRQAVCEACYQAATVMVFVGCHASSVSHALQREAVAKERR